MASFLTSVDSALDTFFHGWNVYSTCLSVLVVTVLFYPLFFAAEPDIHPYLLARQSTASPVRQPGESAVYRSLETPHGYPLRSGLDVKDEGAPRWSSGRDGDLRDVWREALRGDSNGGSGDKGGSAHKARLIKVEGVRGSESFELAELSKQINIIGKRLQIEGGEGARVAIFLSNTPELLVALFATAFYGLKPILIPPGLPAQLSRVLREQEADVLVTSTRALSKHHMSDVGSRLKHIIWVGESDRQSTEWSADWTSEWHGLIEANQNSTSAELPNTSFESGAPPGPVLISAAPSPAKYTAVEFTQANITSAISSQLTAVTRTLRFSSADTLLSLVPLISSHTLVLVLAGLYAHASIALYTRAGFSNASNPDTDAFSNPSIQPTIVLASPQNLFSVLYFPHPTTTSDKLSHWQRQRSLAAGQMPFANSAPAKPSKTSVLYGARLVYVASPGHSAAESTASTASTGTAPSGSSTDPAAASEITPRANWRQQLSVRTGARVVYALTAPQVAGAVTQSNAFDYRADEGSGKHVTRGAPLSSVEVKVVEDRAKGVVIGDEADATAPRGRVVVRGPAVAQGEVTLDVVGRFVEDGTLRVG